MPKNKGKVSHTRSRQPPFFMSVPRSHISQQGGKNRRRGKNENDNEKRELTFKEEGQGTYIPPPFTPA